MLLKQFSADARDELPQQFMHLVWESGSRKQLAVGFKMFASDAVGRQETYHGILKDARVSKIVLGRTDKVAQYVSRERAVKGGYVGVNNDHVQVDAFSPALLEIPNQCICRLPLDQQCGWGSTSQVQEDIYSVEEHHIEKRRRHAREDLETKSYRAPQHFGALCTCRLEQVAGHHSVTS